MDHPSDLMELFDPDSELIELSLPPITLHDGIGDDTSLFLPNLEQALNSSDDSNLLDSATKNSDVSLKSNINVSLSNGFDKGVDLQLLQQASKIPNEKSVQNKKEEEKGMNFAPSPKKQSSMNFSHKTDIKLARAELTEIPSHVFESAAQLHFLNLNRNLISEIPINIKNFTSLVELNLGWNQIKFLPREFTNLTSLVRLDLSGNQLRILPPGFIRLKNLQQLQLNGNRLEALPDDIFELTMLLKLHVGGNQIQSIPDEIKALRNLQVLYLGGNRLTSIPSSVAGLINLEVLYLGDNQIHTIPEELCQMRRLRTLNLHNNRFEYLPQRIVSMPNLQNLSIRGNPLVTQFVNDDESFEQPLSLMELAGRVIKTHRINYHHKFVPMDVQQFLDSARRCNNPSCGGVYFQSSVKNLQVVDFCGKFRVPLIKFLCRQQCTGNNVAYPTCKVDASSKPCAKKMKRALLDNYQGITCDCIACVNARAGR